MTESEKVKAYELSECGKELLAKTFRQVTYQSPKSKVGDLENSLYFRIMDFSAYVGESKKEATDDPECLRYLESDEVLLETLMDLREIAMQAHRRMGRQELQMDKVNKIIQDCIRRGWINENDIRDIKRVGFDL